MDKRTEEFHELIAALTAAATALMAQQTHANDHTLEIDEEEQARETHLEALETIKTRIFIAKDVTKMDLFDRWSEGVRAMRKSKSIEQFEETYEKLREEIIRRAVR